MKLKARRRYRDREELGHTIALAIALVSLAMLPLLCAAAAFALAI
jgi:hypothetical protein